MTNWRNWGHTVRLPNYSFTVAGYLGLREARCRSSVCWGQANVLKEGKPATDSVVFSCRVMLILLEMGARLDRHSSIMKRSVFIQIKILVNPSLGPPLIINTTFCNEPSVHNYVICLERLPDYLSHCILILNNMKDGYPKNKCHCCFSFFFTGFKMKIWCVHMCFEACGLIKLWFSPVLREECCPQGFGALPSQDSGADVS